MNITIKHGEETKTFELEKLDEMQLKNVELFLVQQKDGLFEEFLQGKRLHADGYVVETSTPAFERYHEINDAMTKIETFKFEKEFSV